MSTWWVWPDGCSSRRREPGVISSGNGTGNQTDRFMLHRACQTGLEVKQSSRNFHKKSVIQKLPYIENRDVQWDNRENEDENRENRSFILHKNDMARYSQTSCNKLQKIFTRNPLYWNSIIWKIEMFIQPIKVSRQPPIECAISRTQWIEQNEKNRGSETMFWMKYIVEKHRYGMRLQ